MASSSPESDGASLTLNALDGGTLAKVYAHLDPRDIVRVSASSKQCDASAANNAYCFTTARRRLLMRPREQMAYSQDEQ